MASSTLITDYLGQGTHAARPATPPVPAGGTAIYVETDTNNTFVWLNAAWVQVNSPASAGGTGLYSQVLSTTPTSASTGLTTWVNQGTATVADGTTGVVITQPSNASADVWAFRTKAVPATPYSFSALVSLTSNPQAAGIQGVALGWYDGTNKSQLVRMISNTDSASQLYVSSYSTPSAFNVNHYGAQNFLSIPVWLKIRDDGTNVHFAYSMDGANYIDLYSIAKASGYLGSTGYSNVLFGAESQNYLSYATLLSFTQGT